MWVTNQGINPTRSGREGQTHQHSVPAQRAWKKTANFKRKTRKIEEKKIPTLPVPPGDVLIPPLPPSPRSSNLRIGLGLKTEIWGGLGLKTEIWVVWDKGGAVLRAGQSAVIP